MAERFSKSTHFCQCAGCGTFQSLNGTALKWVSFLYSYPSVRVERWGRGGRDLQRFPCALDLKVSVSVNFTSNGHGLLLSLWSGRRRGYLSWIQASASTCSGSKWTLQQCKNSLAKGLLRMEQDQGWGLITQLPVPAHNGGSIDSL